MNMEVLGCLHVVMHCAEDVAVTLRNVAFVLRVPLDLCSFIIQDEHVTTLDHEVAHKLDGCVYFRQGKVENYFEATRASRHEKPPALAAAVRIDVNNVHCFVCDANDTVLRETVRQMGIKVTRRWGYCQECLGAKRMRKPSLRPRRAVLRMVCGASTPTSQDHRRRQ